MILATHTVPINALPEIVWSLWHDVESWPSWDPSLASSSLKDSFVVGARGELLMKNGQRASFVITECVPYNSFTIAGKLFGATLHFEHDLREVDGTVYVRHTAYLTGVLKPVFWILMKNDFKKIIPESLNNLASLAEHFGYNQTVPIDDID